MLEVLMPESHTSQKTRGHPEPAKYTEPLNSTPSKFQGDGIGHGKLELRKASRGQSAKFENGYFDSNSLSFTFSPTPTGHLT